MRPPMLQDGLHPDIKPQPMGTQIDDINRRINLEDIGQFMSIHYVNCRIDNEIKPISIVNYEVKQGNWPSCYQRCACVPSAA